MNEEVSELRKELGIDDWLELVKEDKNLNGAYISFAQYMYLFEKENQELKKQLGNYKNRYVNCLNRQLSEDIEPDAEDFYLAEIEGKANDYDELKTKYNNLLKENFKLKQHPQHNWNELKKWLELIVMQEREGKTIYLSFKDILSKMQELEQGKDE